MNPVAAVFTVLGLGVWALLMPRYDWPSLLLGAPAVWAGWVTFRLVSTFSVVVPAAEGLRWILGVGGYLFVQVPADIARSTISVFREVSRPHLHIRPAIVAVPIPHASREALMLLAYGICLTPGEQVVEIDEARRILYIHAMKVPDPDRFRAGVVAVFDRYLRTPVGGSAEERE